MCLGVGGINFDKKKIWKALAQNLLILITFEKRVKEGRSGVGYRANKDIKFSGLKEKKI